MSLRLSPKHCVNPSLGLCFFCHKAKEVILFGLMKDDAEAPRQVVMNQEPCDDCREYMAKGVICISINPKLTTDKRDPWRSGRWAVITDAGMSRFGMDAALLAQVLEKRVCFMEDEVWDKLGIPVGEIKEGEQSDE